MIDWDTWKIFKRTVDKIIILSHSADAGIRVKTFDNRIAVFHVCSSLWSDANRRWYHLNYTILFFLCHSFLRAFSMVFYSWQVYETACIATCYIIVSSFRTSARSILRILRQAMAYARATKPMIDSANKAIEHPGASARNSPTLR